MLSQALVTFQNSGNVPKSATVGFRAIGARVYLFAGPPT